MDGFIFTFYNDVIIEKGKSGFAFREENIIATQK